MDGTMSEKEEIIKLIIERNNLYKKETIMTGDRKHDVIGAYKNNIDSIAVMYGYGGKEELVESKPTYLCKNVLDIIRFLFCYNILEK